MRPILTTSSNSRAFASSDPASRRIAGSRRCVTRLRRGDVDRRGNDVVAGLPAIDVVVRMRAGEPADHLVGVHVGGGAAAGLEDVDARTASSCRPSTTSWRPPRWPRSSGGKSPISPFTLAAALLISPSARMKRARKAQPADREVLRPRAGSAPRRAPRVRASRPSCAFHAVFGCHAYIFARLVPIILTPIL